MADDVNDELNVAPSVMVHYMGLSSTSDEPSQYDPPPGWFIDEVLGVAASNGMGVIIVMRPLG